METENNTTMLANREREREGTVVGKGTVDGKGRGKGRGRRRGQPLP